MGLCELRSWCLLASPDTIVFCIYPLMLVRLPSLRPYVTKDNGYRARIMTYNFE